MSPISSATLHHTCFVVADLESVARSMADSLGIRPWNVWTITPESCTLHGKSVAPFTFRVAIAQVGDSNYELLEPVDGDSVYVDHLRDHGNGFHHTCVALATQEALRSARDDLLAGGRSMIQSGDLGALGEFCYFDIAETGSVLELLYLTELPPPEAVIE